MTAAIDVALAVQLADCGGSVVSPRKAEPVPLEGYSAGMIRGNGSITHWQTLFPAVPQHYICEVVRKNNGKIDAAAQNAIFNKLTKYSKKKRPADAALDNVHLPNKDQPERGFSSSHSNEIKEPTKEDPMNKQVVNRTQIAKSFSQKSQGQRPIDQMVARSSSAFASLSSSVVAPYPTAHFHIYWDYDNILINTAASPMQVICEVQTYLKRQTPRHNVQFHMEAFLVPQSSVCPYQLNNIRDIGVKVVQCSEKKGDADRQLTNSLRDFMCLDVARDNHQVVILSSDKDFNAAAEDARRHGYRTWCFHQANPGSSHEQILRHVYEGQCVSLRLLLARSLERR